MMRFDRLTVTMSVVHIGFMSAKCARVQHCVQVDGWMMSIQCTLSPAKNEFRCRKQPVRMRCTNEVFTLPDTDTDTDTNKKVGCKELCISVHTA